MLCGSAWRLLRLRRERREVRRRRQNVVERLPFCDASLRHVRDEARMREILHHSPLIQRGPGGLRPPGPATCLTPNVYFRTSREIPAAACAARTRDSCSAAAGRTVDW